MLIEVKYTISIEPEDVERVVRAGQEEGLVVKDDLLTRSKADIVRDLAIDSGMDFLYIATLDSAFVLPK